MQFSRYIIGLLFISQIDLKIRTSTSFILSKGILMRNLLW